MKKLIYSFVFAFIVMVSANAQIAPGMKYKDVKDLYEPKAYVPQPMDPYSRGWAGVASFVIPGLGQVICGESGRGLAFFGGNLAASIVANTGLKKFLNNVDTDGNGKVTGYTDEHAAKQGIKMALGAMLCGLVVEIWSTADAVRVAKVKNMYYQDLYRGRSSVDMHFEPFFTFAPSSVAVTGNACQPAAGMSMKLSF